MKIDFITDNTLIIPEYIIDLKNRSKKTIELIEKYEKLKNLNKTELENNIIDITEKKFQKKKFKRKKFFKKKVK